MSSPSKATVGKAIASATSAGEGADGHNAPDVSPEAADGPTAEEPEEADAEALTQARLAQYEKIDVHGKIAYLRRRMASDNQLLAASQDRPNSGDAVALRIWNDEMSRRNGQINGEVHHYQELMREKLERIGAKPETSAVALRATDDPASAVRDALSQYHKQCLVTDSYYAIGADGGDASGMDVEERGEILEAVAALDDSTLAPALPQAPRR